ncbi:hypothetical protein NLG97_g2409 [Lecanicillium saksenae]|uniref:Uncharacterized protein n=1 Tax=Lecanicillium saksenae TaxID=468837 RepID=A0ACC1R1M8_9HYPO|nr:hypothetical protein NLG97_g2409 [Lecanicillium saksenae]
MTAAARRRKIQDDGATLVWSACREATRFFVELSGQLPAQAALPLRIVFPFVQNVGHTPQGSEHNDYLTRAERWLFLCQGTENGQILADAAARSDEQINYALGRPPPFVLLENIQMTVGDKYTSVADVVRDFWNPDRTADLIYLMAQVHPSPLQPWRPSPGPSSSP